MLNKPIIFLLLMVALLGMFRSGTINAATAGSLINRDFSFLGTLMSSEKLHCEWSEAIQFSFQ